MVVTGLGCLQHSNMSDQPLLCKPALQREITRSLNIEPSVVITSNAASEFEKGSLHKSPSPNHPVRVIKSSGRNYGSFTNTACTDSFFQHRVQDGETLQAISLKYNISVEQLKRINKLYSNEAFFLKESILIPCPDVIPIDMTLVSQDGAHTLMDRIDSIEKQKNKAKPKSQAIAISRSPQNGTADKTSSLDHSNNDSHNYPPNQRVGNTPPTPSITDLFSKWDQNIQEAQSKMEKIAQNSSCSSVNHSSSSESLQTTSASVYTNSSSNNKKSSSSKRSRSAHRKSPSLFPESDRHDELYKL